ncbi:MAG: hypothetical protein ACXVBX_13940 [Flavisolibacter sp.]
MRTVFCILLLFVTSIFVSAQSFKIRNYSLGYRAFELEPIGNNPLTVTPLMKDPQAYFYYINRIQWNGLYGNPAVQIQRNYSANAEWYKSSTKSRFWKKHTIQIGFLLSNRLTKGNMGLENQKVIVTSTDTALFSDVLWLTQKQQFAGINTGITRRGRICNSVTFITGFHFEAGVAFFHKYTQKWDSSIFHAQIWTTKTSQLPDLKGTNFLQWRMVAPIGFEWNAYKHQVYLRAEFDLGIVGDRYRTSALVQREAAGFGVSLIYQPEG